MNERRIKVVERKEMEAQDGVLPSTYAFLLRQRTPPLHPLPMSIPLMTSNMVLAELSSSTMMMISATFPSSSKTTSTPTIDGSAPMMSVMVLILMRNQIVCFLVNLQQFLLVAQNFQCICSLSCFLGNVWC